MEKINKNEIQNYHKNKQAILIIQFFKYYYNDDFDNLLKLIYNDDFFLYFGKVNININQNDFDNLIIKMINNIDNKANFFIN